MRVVVLGLKGSGKTTVLKRVIEKRPDIKIFIAGDYFTKVFNKHGLKRDEGDLGIKSTEYIQFDKEIFKTLGKDVKKHENVILDTHLFLTKREGYYPGLPWFKIKEIMPDILVVLEYRPEDIVKRRRKDIKNVGRKRSAELTVDGVKLEYEIQRHYAFAASALTGCTVKILQQLEPEKYEFEHAEKNAEEIIKLFE